MKIPIYLRAWREEKGLTQSELAQRSRFGQGVISRIEAGKEDPRISTLHQLAQAIGIDLKTLLQFPRETLSLNRHEIDQVGRAVLSGERQMSPLSNKLADDIASLMIQKLKAHKVPGARRLQQKRWDVLKRTLWIRQKYSEVLVKQISLRIDKLIGGIQ